MFRAFLMWAVLATAFFFPSPCLAGEKVQETGQVASWSDGDTAILTDGRRIRLIGLDTPEIEKRNQPGWYYGQEAHAFVQRMTGKSPVRIIFFVEKGKKNNVLRDRYDRFLGEILLPDGRSLNEELLAKGMAFYSSHSNIPLSIEKRLLAAQRTALKKRAGCWQKILTLPESQEIYIGNRNSRRFFSKSCLKKASVAKRNQKIFSDLQAAFAAGYAPARACGIWPLEAYSKNMDPTRRWPWRKK